MKIDSKQKIACISVALQKGRKKMVALQSIALEKFRIYNEINL